MITLINCMENSDNSLKSLDNLIRCIENLDSLMDILDSSDSTLPSSLDFWLSYLSSSYTLSDYPNVLSNYLSSPCTLLSYLNFVLNYLDVLPTWKNSTRVLSTPQVENVTHYLLPNYLINLETQYIYLKRVENVITFSKN